MNLLIDTKGHKMLVAVTERTGALIEALSDVVLIVYEYKDGRYVYRPAGTKEGPETMDVTFVADSFLAEPTPLIDDLTANLKRSERRWGDEYSKRIALERELTELKKKVAELMPTTDKEE